MLTEIYLCHACSRQSRNVEDGNGRAGEGAHRLGAAATGAMAERLLADAGRTGAEGALLLTEADFGQAVGQLDVSQWSALAQDVRGELGVPAAGLAIVVSDVAVELLSALKTEEQW
jgi:hypothetical protein